MKKILFICHGNICRSPMAEFVMKDLVEKAGLSGQFEIASAATSTEEIGNPVYPPARRKLAEHGICCAGKTARQMTRRDYESYDYLIAMDHNNLRNMTCFVGSDPDHKVSLLMDHTRRLGDVADPWYTGDFEATWQDVLDGCTYLYAEIKEPGVILQSGPYCRIVFGPRDHNIDVPIYQQMKRDFDESGITGELTAHIQRDALQKFSYVSPVGSTGLYYNAVAADMQKPGEARDCFIAMVREISALADAMGCPFDHDVVPDDLAILDGIAPTATTSMQRDIADGHQSEIDGLIYEVVRLGEEYHVAVPTYAKVAEEMKRRGL